MATKKDSAKCPQIQVALNTTGESCEITLFGVEPIALFAITQQLITLRSSMLVNYRDTPQNTITVIHTAFNQELRQFLRTMCKDIGYTYIQLTPALDTAK